MASMRGLRVSTKRIQIDKANSTIVIAVGVAAFAVAFSLVSAKSLLARQAYQNKVITAREQARDQLLANLDAVDDLKIKYAEFVGRQENIIKGSSTGSGDRDGDNARIVLDALPSKYDFPALASSLEKILVDRNFNIQSITGTDDEIVQNGGGEPSADTSIPSVTPEDAAQQQLPGSAVDMPFEVAAEGSYKAMIGLLTAFKTSIRPLYVQTLTFTAGNGDTIQLDIKGKTFYQPARTLNIAEEIVQ